LPANLAVLLTGLEFANRAWQIKSRALIYSNVASATAIHLADLLAAMFTGQFGRFAGNYCA
jgi:hypothetical protein